MFKRLAALMVAALATTVAWAGDVTQPRPVGAFESVRVDGAADVTIQVGAAASVTVTADEKTVALVTTEVKDSALVIAMKRGARNVKGKIRVQITNPTLTGITLSGAGSIAAQGVRAEQFQANLSGAGRLMCDGSVRVLNVVVSGAGNASLKALAAHDATVTLSGTGKIDVRASDSLTARVSGVGDVHYAGAPARRDCKVSGVGKIVAD